MSIAEDFQKLRESKIDITAKILIIDIETSPSLAYVWKLWDENVPLDRLIQSGEILSFAAKWHGNPEVIFYSVYHDGYNSMIEAIWELLDQADIVVHFNGKRFDIPHINRAFLLSGLTPPSPYAQIDLYQVVRSVFKFVSNKLDHIAQQLGVGKKVKHRGFDLWVLCMTGTDEQKKSAWQEMKEYNCQDVILTDEVYERLIPWIKNHPTVLPLITDQLVCPRCGSKNIAATDVAMTNTMSYDAYVCSDCGGWARGRTGTRITQVRSI